MVALARLKCGVFESDSNRAILRTNSATESPPEIAHEMAKMVEAIVMIPILLQVQALEIQTLFVWKQAILDLTLSK